MIHRHLQYAAETLLSELPAAAIADILDRGDLADWEPLANAVAADPNGRLSQTIERLIDAYPMYGTSPLWRAFIERCRRHGSSTEHHALPLADARRRQGLSQVAVAAELGISQSDLSKLERRSDLRLSTLDRYAKAIGGKLRIAIRFADDEVAVYPHATPSHPDPAGASRRAGQG